MSQQQGVGAASAATVVDRGELFRKELDDARARGLTVGLVPTMGALHAGHGSLVALAAAECDLVAVTVFVNPLQFDAAQDLAAYPSDLDTDVAIAGDAGAHLVFAPDVSQMWPGGAPPTAVHVAGVSAGLEGRSRPGHFDGVATVVARLFNLAGPCRAYFGEKDFQQLAVVRTMANDLAFPVEVVACPTVREPDGLARSSRNVRLAGVDREAAVVLVRALKAAQQVYRSGGAGVGGAGGGGTAGGGAGGAAGAVGAGCDAGALRWAMAEVVAGEPRALLDYAEVVDALTLEPLNGPVGVDARLVIAAVVGGVRLIDNCALGENLHPAADGRPA